VAQKSHRLMDRERAARLNSWFRILAYNGDKSSYTLQGIDVNTVYDIPNSLREGRPQARIPARTRTAGCAVAAQHRVSPSLSRRRHTRRISRFR
jgi:hypothetical protein